MLCEWKAEQREGMEQTEKTQSMKDRILYESLKLFADNGYAAVSTRMIAKAVEASDAVIYKHFKNKREILDTILERCKTKYLAKRNTVKLATMCWDEVEKICMDMFAFQTQDEWIVLYRKLLIVEQYKDPQMAMLYRRMFIEGPLESLAGMFRILIEQGYMKKGNPMVYAMELYAPFFLFHTVEGKSEELLQNLEAHVRVFRKNVRELQ
jgi:TetR/AcrR family transcriptional regulator, repressor for uid operon